MKLYRNIALCSSLVIVAENSPSPSDLESRTHQIAPASTTQGESQLRVERGTHRTSELVERFAKHLGWTVLNTKPSFDQAWQSTITTRQLTLAKKESIDVLSQLLYGKGLVIAPLSVKDKTYEMINTMGSRRHEVLARAVIMNDDEVLAQRNRYMPVGTSIELNHFIADEAEIQTILFPLVIAGHTTRLAIRTKGRRVFLTGLAPAVAIAIEMLKAIDKPEHPAVNLDARLKGIEDRIAALERQSK